MDDKPKYPWRLATNERYRDVVKTLMTLSTASLLLPVFFAREFLGVEGKVPLKDVVGWPVICSWVLLGLAIFSGIAFHFLSAKWVRLAWGQETDFWRFPVTETAIERFLNFFFWSTALTFMSGFAFVIAFLFGYGSRP
jgi:hypothetical protein